MRFIPLALVIFIVVEFVRNNVLAYVVAALALAVFNPAVSLFSQAAPYYEWNGALLVGLLLAIYLAIFKIGAARITHIPSAE